MRLLAKRREDRVQSAREVVEGIEAIERSVRVGLSPTTSPLGGEGRGEGSLPGEAESPRSQALPGNASVDAPRPPLAESGVQAGAAGPAEEDAERRASAFPRGEPVNF